MSDRTFESGTFDGAVFDTVFRGRALIGRAGDARRGHDGFAAVEVGITGGRIARIAHGGAGLEGRETVTLADDEVLIPGLVDTHVHINEPGRTEWEGFATATAAAAAGGVTTLIDMPLNSIPPTTTPANLAVKRATAEGAVTVDVGFWGGAVPQNLGSLGALYDEGVFGFKSFMAPSGVDEFENLDPEQLVAALAELAGIDGMLILHAEDAGVLHDHEGHGGPSYAEFMSSRPPAAELAAIEMVIAALRQTGARAHIVHLASAAAIPLIRAARAEGIRISAETCPHYLALSAEGIPDGATQYKCAPPIRGEANRDGLWQGLLDGDISMIVTDHSPSTPELKFAGHGDFSLAWGGIAGLQVGLSAVWTAAAARGIGLDRVIGWMSEATSAFVGLSDRGAIIEGANADLAIFAPDAPREIRATELLHKNPVSAFDGASLRGLIRGTWLRGHPVSPRHPHRAAAVAAEARLRTRTR